MGKIERERVGRIVFFFSLLRKNQTYQLFEGRWVIETKRWKRGEGERKRCVCVYESIIAEESSRVFRRDRRKAATQR